MYHCCCRNHRGGININDTVIYFIIVGSQTNLCMIILTVFLLITNCTLWNTEGSNTEIGISRRRRWRTLILHSLWNIVEDYGHLYWNLYFKLWKTGESSTAISIAHFRRRRNLMLHSVFHFMEDGGSNTARGISNFITGTARGTTGGTSRLPVPLFIFFLPVVFLPLLHLPSAIKKRHTKIQQSQLQYV